MQDIRIETYRPELRVDFVRLNNQWIERYFHLEASDSKAFENIEEYIIRPGGQIFFAILPGGDCGRHDEVIGCCALIPRPDLQCYELAKMAVSPEHQGHGTGMQLGKALIAYARNLGAKHLFLEGNTRLEASIALYRKLGFQEETKERPSYERCDIVMGMDL